MERPTSEVDLRSRIRCTRHEKKKEKEKGENKINLRLELPQKSGAAEFVSAIVFSGIKATYRGRNQVQVRRS